VSTLAPPPTETSTLPELEAVRAKLPPGSVLPQDGLDQPTWIVSRDVLADVARELAEINYVAALTIGVPLAERLRKQGHWPFRGSLPA